MYPIPDDFRESTRCPGVSAGKSFSQEYECSFVEVATSIFPWEVLKRALVDKAVTESGKTVIGWDPARDRDSSAVIVLRIAPDHHKEVVASYDLSGIPYNEQVARVVEIAASWGVSMIYVDAFAQGDPIADFLGRGPAVSREKMRRDDNRAAAAYIRYELERDKLSIAPDVEDRKKILKHLQAFDNEKGRFPYRTHKGHADFGPALLLAWQAVPRRVRRRAREVSREIRTRGARKRRPWYYPSAA